MELSAAGLALIKREEKFMPRLYYCEAKKPTIGYGHVVQAHEQHLLKATLTEAQASEMLRKDVAAVYGRAVSNAVTHHPTQNQYDAMVSLCFNIGVAGFAKSSVLRLHNTGKATAQAMTLAFAAWNKVTDPKTKQKRESKGLTARRAREAALYNS